MKKGRIVNLQQALQQSQFNGLSDDEALALGNTIVDLAPDSTAYTWAGIGQKLIENGVDHRWCISAGDLSGVDSTCAINRVCDNASGINRGVGDTDKVTLEDALAANDVAG